MPSTAQELAAIARGFQALTPFGAIPGCVGTIDGYLLQIEAHPSLVVGNVIDTPPLKEPLPTIGHELWGRAHVGYSGNFGMTEHSKIYISVYKKFKCDITALC